MNRTKWTWILAGVLVAWTALPHRSMANVQEASGISPKATAMGNAYAAVADDFSAVYYNPAGLAQKDHHSFFLGYMWVKPYMKQYLLSSPATENARGYESYRSFIFGSTVDLSAIADTRGHNLVLGVVATAGDNFKASWRIHDWNPKVPRFIRSGDYMSRAHIYTAAGLEVLKDRVYIGGGINLYQDIPVTVKTTADLAGNVISQDAEIGGDFEVSPIVGALIKPWHWLSVAYTYRGGWQQRTPTNVAATIQGLEFLDISVLLPVQDYYLPWNMTAGLAVRPTERVLFSVDVTHYNWSSFRPPIWRDPGKSWSNTIVPRAGLQVRVWDGLVARGGYYFDPSPVPDQYDVESNYLDFDKHVFSVGLGYAFSSLPWLGKLPLYHPVEIDGYFQYQYLPRRYQSKNPAMDPTNWGWYIEGKAYALGIGITTGF